MLLKKNVIIIMRDMVEDFELQVLVVFFMMALEQVNTCRMFDISKKKSSMNGMSM